MHNPPIPLKGCEKDGTIEPGGKKDALVKPLLIWAMSWGASVPPFTIALLKSSTAFPNHMRMMRKDVKPDT